MIGSFKTIRPLPPALQKVAIEELNEVPSRVESDIATLKEWLQKQPHICACLENQWLGNRPAAHMPDTSLRSGCR